jgi:hypothetical protein
MRKSAVCRKREQKRRRFGVVAYLSGKQYGKVEMRLDDLELVGENPPKWRHWVYFTSSFFDEKTLLSHQLTEKEYAAIGMAVAARLAALEVSE